MNGFERSKHQLNVNGVPQSRVQDLGADLMGLFGSVEKGVNTYNKVGEAGARLEFSSMYRDSLEELDMMSRQMKELPDDDVESRLQMASRMEEIKGGYTKKLADFSNHPAAYEVFAKASSEALHSINSSYQTPMFESMQKAQVTKTTNEVNSEYSATGLNIVPSQAQSNLDKLKLIYNPDEADKQNKKLIGLGVMSTIATNDASFNPLEIMMQTTSTDKVTGMTLSDRNKTKDFINKNLLRGSEVAQLRVETGEDGVERFVVDGLLNDEDKLKIVKYADKYMGYAQAPKEGKSSSIVLDALVKDSRLTIDGHDKENPMPSIVENASKLKNYTQTDEYRYIVEHGTDEDKLKIAGLQQAHDIFTQKALVIENLIKHPSSASLSKLKSGNGYPIEVRALTSYFDATNPNAKTTMYLSKEEADSVLSTISSRAEAAFAQQNYPEASRLQGFVEDYTGRRHSTAAKIVQQTLDGTLNVSAPKEMELAIAAAEADPSIPYYKIVKMKQMYATLRYENGNVDPKSVDMFRATSQKFRNTNNELVTKVSASLGEVIGIDNTMSASHIPIALQDIAMTHNINVEDTSAENIKLLASAIAKKTARIDTTGANDIVVYNKTGLTEQQLSTVIGDIADKMEVGDPSVTDEKGKIDLDYNPNSFEISYGETGKTMQFIAYDKTKRVLKKSKVFSLREGNDDSIQKYYWNLKLPKKDK